MSTTRVNSGSASPGMHPKIHEQPNGKWGQGPLVPVVFKTWKAVSTLVLSLFVPRRFEKMEMPSDKHPLIDRDVVPWNSRTEETQGVKESGTEGSFGYVGVREFLSDRKPERCDLKGFLGLSSVENLGRGSFGSVDLVVATDGKEYALKEIYHDPAKYLKRLESTTMDQTGTAKA